MSLWFCLSHLEHLRTRLAKAKEQCAVCCWAPPGWWIDAFALSHHHRIQPLANLGRSWQSRDVIAIQHAKHIYIMEFCNVLYKYRDAQVAKWCKMSGCKRKPEVLIRSYKHSNRTLPSHAVFNSPPCQSPRGSNRCHQNDWLIVS